MLRKLSEERACKKMIDTSTGSARRLQLERAGWYLPDRSLVDIEFSAYGYGVESWNGMTDCTLYRENVEVPVLGEVEGLAVVKSVLLLSFDEGVVKWKP